MTVSVTSADGLASHGAAPVASRSVAPPLFRLIDSVVEERPSEGVAITIRVLP